jgi:hypothetical protein
MYKEFSINRHLGFSISTNNFEKYNFVIGECCALYTQKKQQFTTTLSSHENI